MEIEKLQQNKRVTTEFLDKLKAIIEETNRFYEVVAFAKKECSEQDEVIKHLVDEYSSLLKQTNADEINQHISVILDDIYEFFDKLESDQFRKEAVEGCERIDFVPDEDRLRKDVDYAKKCVALYKECEKINDNKSQVIRPLSIKRVFNAGIISNALDHLIMTRGAESIEYLHQEALEGRKHIDDALKDTPVM